MLICTSARVVSMRSAAVAAASPASAGRTTTFHVPRTQSSSSSAPPQRTHHHHHHCNIRMPLFLPSNQIHHSRNLCTISNSRCTFSNTPLPFLESTTTSTTTTTFQQLQQLQQQQLQQQQQRCRKSIISSSNVKSFSTNAGTPATPIESDHPEIEVVHAENAPKAIGPYSQAIKACNTLYVSGCLGLDPKTAEFPSDDVQEQARQAITNLKRILIAGDSSLARVVKTTVLLTDINDFAKVNAVYSEYFTGVKPARTTYAVAALPKNAKVEIEAIALVGKGPSEEHIDEDSTATNNKPSNSER